MEAQIICASFSELVDISFAGQRVYVQINFLCDHSNDVGTPEFSRQEDMTYIFTFSTAQACAPSPVECKVSDNLGNDYDLSSLVRDDFWKTEDSRDDQTKYFINVCRPVNNVPDGECPGELSKTKL